MSNDRIKDKGRGTETTNHSPKIPISRPKNITDKQWDTTVNLYNTAARNGDKFPELTVAQAILETGWFKSPAGKYNYFGQKATSGQQGSVKNTKEVAGGQVYKTQSKFRDYNSLDEAVQDRVKKWGSKYQNAENVGDALYSIWKLDPQKGSGVGYATDPNYDKKIGSILNTIGVDFKTTQSTYQPSESQTTETPQFQTPATFEVVQGAGNPQETYDQFLKELAVKEQEEKKVETSSARQEVEQKKEVVSAQQQFLQAFANATAPIQDTQAQPQQQIQRVQPLMQQPSVGIQTSMPEMPNLFQQGGTMSFNTQEEYQRGLTGAPEGTTGVFNYPNAEEREFIRTDRDLRLFADGREIGVLDKNNPSLIVPPAYQVVEKEFQDGGTLGNPIYQATFDYLNANPYMDKDKPLTLDKLTPTVPTPGQYPKMIKDRLEIAGVGIYQAGEYEPIQMPEDYKGLPLYKVNGKIVSIDKDFNKEYLNFYKDEKFLGKDILYPVYGKGTPYTTQP